MCWKSVFTFLILGTSCVGAGLGGVSENLAAQVRAAETAFAQTMADRDLDTFGTFVAEEAVFFGSSEIHRGRPAIMEAWGKYFVGEEAPFSWRPETIEVLDSGSLALSTGPVLDADEKQIGIFQSIWRREEDGRWKVVFDKGCPHCSD